MFTRKWCVETIERVIQGSAVGASVGWSKTPTFAQVFSIETAQGSAVGAVAMLIVCVMASRIGDRNTTSFMKPHD